MNKELLEGIDLRGNNFAIGNMDQGGRSVEYGKLLCELEAA